MKEELKDKHDACKKISNQTIATTYDFSNSSYLILVLKIGWYDKRTKRNKKVPVEIIDFDLENFEIGGMF